LQPSQVEQSHELQLPQSQVQVSQVQLSQDPQNSEVAETGNTAVATMDKAISSVFIMKYLSKFQIGESRRLQLKHTGPTWNHDGHFGGGTSGFS
jgi:hypothetical protein